MVTYQELINGCVWALSQYSTSGTKTVAFNVSATIQRHNTRWQDGTDHPDSYTTTSTITETYTLPNKGAYTDTAQINSAIGTALANGGVNLSSQVPEDRLTAAVVTIATITLRVYRTGNDFPNGIAAATTPDTALAGSLTQVSSTTFNSMTERIAMNIGMMTAYSGTSKTATCSTISCSCSSSSSSCSSSSCSSSSCSTSCCSTSSSSSSSSSSCSSSWFVAFYDLSL